MVLHGLWPNQKNCGIRYGYCGVTAKRSHCDYYPVSLSEPVANALRQFMPSYAYGTCLERHEWNKHGSCQMLTMDDYFSIAVRLAQEANQTKFNRFIQAHIGEIVERAQLKHEVEKDFGQNAAGKVYLGCRNGTLVDIFINLPALIPQAESLQSLVDKASDYGRDDHCPEKIMISDFVS